jgi:hypothetical protein
MQRGGDRGRGRGGQDRGRGYRGGRGGPPGGRGRGGYVHIHATLLLKLITCQHICRGPIRCHRLSPFQLC